MNIIFTFVPIISLSARPAEPRLAPASPERGDPAYVPLGGRRRRGGGGGPQPLLCLGGGGGGVAQASLLGCWRVGGFLECWAPPTTNDVPGCLWASHVFLGPVGGGFTLGVSKNLAHWCLGTTITPFPFGFRSLNKTHPPSGLPPVVHPTAPAGGDLHLRRYHSAYPDA